MPSYPPLCGKSGKEVKKSYPPVLRHIHYKKAPQGGDLILARKRKINLYGIIIFGILIVFFGLWQNTSVGVQLFNSSVDWLVSQVLQDPKAALLTSMPALSWQDTPEEMESPSQALLSWLSGVIRIDSTPAGILATQIPLLGQIRSPSLPVIEINQEPLVEEKIGTEDEAVLIGIYNTHTGETYAETDGTDRLEGQRGGVVKVSQAVQEVLEKEHSLRVARSETIHDIRYATSYLESEKTAKEMVAAHAKMIALFDIHRDAGRGREESLVDIKGQKVAPILIIIGSDARRPFPNWKQNYAFACRLSEKMDELYPGLSMGVRVKEGRYNQYLHKGAILVEVGTVNNTLEEAVASGKMLAEALAQLVEEEIKAKGILQQIEEKQDNHLERKEIEDEESDAMVENV